MLVLQHFDPSGVLANRLALILPSWLYPDWNSDLMSQAAFFWRILQEAIYLR
jgi:hypothetical protein